VNWWMWGPRLRPGGEFSCFPRGAKAVGGDPPRSAAPRWRAPAGGPRKPGRPGRPWERRKGARKAFRNGPRSTHSGGFTLRAATGGDDVLFSTVTNGACG